MKPIRGIAERRGDGTSVAARCVLDDMELTERLRPIRDVVSHVGRRPEIAVGDETDAAAIAASLAEPERFTAIFDRHFDRVHGYVRHRVGQNLADEIAADTFLLAFDRRAGYDLTRADARPWLLGIATNVMRGHWRSERRRLAAYDRVDADEASAPAPRAGLETEVGAALRALPRRECEALLLLAWADLSYDEIAVALGIPLGTVRSRISRARARLRERLGASGALDARSAPRPHPPKEAPNV